MSGVLFSSCDASRAYNSMSDERIVERQAIVLPLGTGGKTWTIVPLVPEVPVEPSLVVQTFHEVMETTDEPLLREAASLAVSIMATAQISNVIQHDVIAHQTCWLAHLLLTQPNVESTSVKATVEVLRKAEFHVKKQASSPCLRGPQPHEDIETRILKNDILDMLRILSSSPTVNDTAFDLESSSEHASENDVDTGCNVQILESSSPTPRPCVINLPVTVKELRIHKTWIAFKTAVLQIILKVYLITLLNLPNFYASRMSTWSQNVDPLPSPCPTRNSMVSIAWIFNDDEDVELECDPHFCDRLLTTLLREWKTLRILASIIFAAVLAMLQISRVESDAVASTPAYFSLICGIMAAVSSTILELYFQGGKSSPQILAWSNSLRNKTEPKSFDDDSVVLALPAISTAWCTILFIICIVSFTFHAYTTSPDVDKHYSVTNTASLAFRITLVVVTVIGAIFLLMILVALRRISRRNVVQELPLFRR